MKIANLKLVCLAALMAPATLTMAQNSVTWSTLGNTKDAEGHSVYTQRYVINSNDNFARIAFNSFGSGFRPVNAADTVIEIVPGYYTIGSPRFAEAAGQPVVVDVICNGAFTNICSAPDGVHLIYGDGSTAPVDFVRDNIIRTTNLYATPGRDRMPYGEAVFAINSRRNLAETPGAYDIIPSFKQVTLTAGQPVDAAVCTLEFVKVDNPIADWMQITVDGGKIAVKTNNEPLARARVANLLSRSKQLPAAVITDYPDFGYRGVMIDIVRNYQTPAEMERILSLMSRYGLNVLHFHIADDEGWRLEIPGLPELTEVGGRRGYTLDGADFLPQIYYGDGNPNSTGHSANGFFTRKEYIDFIKKADALGIRVIPEIESPGHARAAILAMENRYRKTGDESLRLIDPNDTSVYTSAQAYHDNVMNLALPGPVNFMKHVGSEIQKMYNEAGVALPAIHIGGDEVAMGAWKGSPVIQEYMAKNGLTNERDMHLIFIRQLVKEYEKMGIPTSGWQEIAVGHSDDFNEAVQPYIYSVNCWSTLGGERSVPAQSAKAGYPTVLSNVEHFYFDQCYNYHPQERGLTWGGIVDEFTALHGYPKELCPVDSNDYKNVIGLSGQVFSETVRSPQMLEQYLLPKMLGLAERAWNADATYSDPRFNAVVNAEMLAWYAGGYTFHVAQPGIAEIDGKIVMNAPYPDAEVRYTLDGSEPTTSSPQYTAPIVTDSKNIRARTFLPQYNAQSLTTLFRPV